MHKTKNSFDSTLKHWRLMAIAYHKYREFLAATHFDAEYDYSLEFSDEISE